METANRIRFDRSISSSYLAWILTIWFVGVLLLGAHAWPTKVNSRKPKCGNNMITRMIDDKRYTCWPCPKCHKGRGSSVECGSTVPMTTEIECVLCKPGISFSDHYEDSTCRFCGVCLPNENVDKKCTRTRNIKCGKCKKGFYRAFTGDCKSCSNIFDVNIMSEASKKECFTDGIVVPDDKNNPSLIIRPTTTSNLLRKMSTTPTSLSTIPTPQMSIYKTFIQHSQSTMHHNTSSLAIATTTTLIEVTSTLSSRTFTAETGRNLAEEKEKNQDLTEDEVLGYVLYIGLTVAFFVGAITVAAGKCCGSERLCGLCKFVCVLLWICLRGLCRCLRGMFEFLCGSDQPHTHYTTSTNYVDDNTTAAAPPVKKKEDSTHFVDVHPDCSDKGDSPPEEETSQAHITGDPLDQHVEYSPLKPDSESTPPLMTGCELGEDVVKGEGEMDFVPADEATAPLLKNKQDCPHSVQKCTQYSGQGVGHQINITINPYGRHFVKYSTLETGRDDSDPGRDAVEGKGDSKFLPKDQEYKLCDLPFSKKNEIGQMLDDAPLGTGNALKIAEHYGMDQLRLRRLRRRFRNRNSEGIGVDVLEFLAATYPCLTVFRFCVKLNDKEFSRKDIAKELCKSLESTE